MTPRLRKLGIVAHVITSVGWIGAVAAFLVLAVAGLTGRAPDQVHAAYLAMQWTTWLVIVPLSLASLVSGLIQSLGTRWGLLRHWWVLIKLAVTVLAVAVLMMHVQPIDRLADAAAQRVPLDAGLRGPQVMMVTASSAALVVLVVATVLSVYKPRGRTSYGWRRRT